MYLVYVLTLSFAAAISLTIAYLSWRRKPAKGSIPMTIIMCSVAEWIIFQLLADITSNHTIKIVFDCLKYIGVSIVPFAWLILSLEYTRRERFLTKKNILLLLIIPLLTILFVAFNWKLELFLKDYSFIDRGFIVSIDTNNGFWFWIHTFYSYAFILIGTVLFIGAFFTLPSIYKKQTGILILGTLIPFAGNILTVFDLIKTPFADITPLLLIFTGLTFFGGLFRYKLLDLIPVARHAVIENMKDIIIVIDIHSRIVDMNPAALKAVGHGSKGIVGRPLAEVLSEWNHLLEKYRDVYDANEKLCVDINGMTRYFDLSLSPIYDKNELTAKLIILRDITQLEEAMLDLKAARETAEAASKAKSQFLATMSHEIRTPMNAIIGMSELLNSTQLDSKQKNYLELIRSSADSLLTIINDILDFSKIEAGRLELEKIDFKLKELVDLVIKGLSVQADSKGLVLNTQIDEKIPENLMGDPTRIRQILVNLIGNAIKFTQKGSISVCVNAIESGSNTVVIEFIVKDTGIGIPEDKISSLFDMFHQLDSSHSRKYGGTGLGLAIVKRLILLMNGTIYVESKSGEGSRFTFSLPLELSTSHSSNTTSSGVITDTSLSGIRILLAEDNKTNQVLMQAMLQKYGWELDIAGNGNEALKMHQAKEYDLILMDIQMPEMDGLEASQAIRTQEGNSGSHTPIIALTANAMKGDKEKCLEAGMDDYLTKPIRAKALYEAICRNLNA